MAKIIRIHPENPQERQINEVVETLKKGGLIVYPSDTVYALGCDINNLKAMEKLAQLKGIKLEKSHFTIICNDLSHLSEFTKPIETSTFRLLKSKLPGAFTFILEANKTDSFVTQYADPNILKRYIELLLDMPCKKD